MPAQQQAIREKAEALDALRKARLAAHAHLTMTDLYNVLEKLRGGAELTDRERRNLQDGTVTVLREYHDELDALVQAAYGWEGQLTDQDILARLTDLNAARAQEERAGTIRYLRPDYQDPRGTAVGDLGMNVQAPAAGFSGVRAGTVDELLELLVKLGQVRQVGTDTVAYAA